MKKEKSNRLAVLAADIRTAHDDVARSSKASAERAVDAGRLLAEAKTRDDIPRGGWERWVEDVAGVPWSTAKRYLQLFVAVSEGRLLVADIAEAGQKGALKAAADPEPSTEIEDPEWTPDELDRQAQVEAGQCGIGC